MFASGLITRRAGPRNLFVTLASILLFALPVFGGAADAAPDEGTADQASVQSSSLDTSGSPAQATDEKPFRKKNERMFFIMPNYFTVQKELQIDPLSWKQKFAITTKSAFDPYEFAIAGALAGVRQAENTYPGFGQGMEGYGKRYVTAFADQVDSNIMVGGVFPTIFKTDPRYFQMGKGRTMVRIVYAFTRILVTRTDSGHRLFNFPEFLGNATTSAISNVYYPASDRGFSA
ncbi:MAG TPA: hypothetical protein VH088_07620, partial [Terriglobales bacterium]|nr:hypothetical protein [Terriglobales bacterium]